MRGKKGKEKRLEWKEGEEWREEERNEAYKIRERNYK